VRTDRHRVVFRVARRTGLPQAPFYITEAVFRYIWYSLPVTVHHDDHNFLVSAGYASRMYAPKEACVFGWYVWLTTVVQLLYVLIHINLISFFSLRKLKTSLN